MVPGERKSLSNFTLLNRTMYMYIYMSMFTDVTYQSGSERKCEEFEGVAEACETYYLVVVRELTISIGH